MKLWIVIVATFLVQEVITTNAVILKAYQAHYSAWVFSAIFIICTVITILLGFSLGNKVQTRFKGKRFVGYINRKAKSFEREVGPAANKFTLLALGMVNISFINAFLASWLSMLFWEIFIWLFIGDMIWYGADIAVILGIHTFINPDHAMYFVLGFSLALAAILAFFHSRLDHKETPENQV